MRSARAFRYALSGAAFGLAFPVAATVSAALSAGSPLALGSVGAVHATTPLLWIIDTVPLWLGLFAWFVGHREAHLQEALEKVHRQQAELQVRAAEAELSRKAAEDIGRVKLTLLTNMGHELRTPLSGILGFAAILAEEVGEELSEFVHLIQQDARRLHETFAAILDLAELEGGEVLLQPADVDVTYTVQEAVRFLTPNASEKGLTLTALGAPLPAVLDAFALHRVVTSLVGNAIKFTETGAVYVETEGDADTVTVRVRDTGPGIPEDFRPHLFDEFRQASTGTQREHEGSGLGLTVAKRLVELMGGAIDVDSVEGEGSTFTVRLPRTLPTQAPGPAADATADATADTPALNRAA